jgi:hypothetical protein
VDSYGHNRRYRLGAISVYRIDANGSGTGIWDIETGKLEQFRLGASELGGSATGARCRRSGARGPRDLRMNLRPSLPEHEVSWNELVMDLPAGFLSRVIELPVRQWSLRRPQGTSGGLYGRGMAATAALRILNH